MEKKWFAMIGGTIGMSVSVGTFFWLALGLYMKPMTAEFGWSRTEFAGAYSAASLVNAIMLPICGYLVDRFGAVRVILVGMVLCAASYASFSFVNSYVTFILVARLVAGTGALASYPSYLALTPKWFDRRLGTALAISASGIGLGAAIFPYIINAGIDNAGWRQAFVYTAAFAIGVGILNFLLLVRDNKGPLPESEYRPLAAGEGVVNVSFMDAICGPGFWMFSIAFSLILLVTLGINFHFAALVTDSGGTPAQGAATVAVLGTASLVARLTTGFLLDRYSIRLVAAIFFVGQAVGCLLLLPGNPHLFYPAAILLGAAQGAELDMLPFVVARKYGRVAYSKIYGSSYAVVALGQIISPLILGRVFDWTGAYTIGLMLFPVLSIIALGLIYFAAGPKREASPANAVPAE